MSSLLPKPRIDDAIPVETFEVRALNALDAHAFRAIRLEAFTGEDSRNFAACDEAQWTTQQWQERCRQTPEKIIFGLFDAGQLVGVMAAWKYEKQERTALWGNVYVREPYRKQHLAKLLYEARSEWTKRNTHYDKAVFFIREDNLRSRKIHESRGAVFLFEEPKRWSDGSTANARWYEKHLNVA